MRIDTYEKLVAMLVLQVANLPTYQTEVGATAADITAVTEELAVLQYLDDLADLVDADKKTLIKIKQTAYNGEMDAEIEPFPVFPVVRSPFAVVAGCLERANRRNRRFKAADGYTKGIGIALGIEGESTTRDPNTVVPTLEAFPAQTGYHAAIVVGNRADSQMWKLLGRRANSEKWTELTSGTGKSADVHIEPTDEGKPERLELKIRLYKNNETYGQPSNPTYATFNP